MIELETNDFERLLGSYWILDNHICLLVEFIYKDCYNLNFKFHCPKFLFSTGNTRIEIVDILELKRLEQSSTSRWMKKL